MASVSGELGSLLYVCSRDNCFKDSKDNALMTPLMNTVSSNHEEAFVYLHFKENCDLRNVDMNGHSLLHLAARSNSINIARLLRLLYHESTKDDSNLEITQDGKGSIPSTARSTSSSSGYDNSIYFDVDRVDNLG